MLLSLARRHHREPCSRSASPRPARSTPSSRKGLGTGAAFVAGVALLIGYGFIAMFALAGAGYYLSILLHRFWPGMPSSAGRRRPHSLVCMAVVCLVVLVRGDPPVHPGDPDRRDAPRSRSSSSSWACSCRSSDRRPTGRVLGLDASPEHLAVGSVLAVTAFVGFESSSTLGRRSPSAVREHPTVPRLDRHRRGSPLPRHLVQSAGGLRGVGGGHHRDADAHQRPGDGLRGRMDGAAARPVRRGVVPRLCDRLHHGVLAGRLLDGSRGGPPVAPRDHARPVPHAPCGDRHGSGRSSRPCSVLALVLTGGAWAAMQVLIVVAAAGYITAYVLVCIAAPVFLWRIGELTLWPLAARGGGRGAALRRARRLPGRRERRRAGVGVWVFLVTMALGIAIWAIRHRRRPWLSSTVGVYDEPVSADVLGGRPRSPGERTRRAPRPTAEGRAQRAHRARGGRAMRCRCDGAGGLGRTRHAEGDHLPTPQPPRPGRVPRPHARPARIRARAEGRRARPPRRSGPTARSLRAR